MKLKYALVFAALLLGTHALAAQAVDPVAWLADHETRLANTTEDSKRLYLLHYMAPAALAAGDARRAAKYSAELADLGVRLRSQPGSGQSLYSDATYISNLVLGHLAIKEGQIEKAKEHLLASGNVSGSAVLNSFGPGMSLAKELLDRGEHGAVIEYLDQCAKFWKMDRGSLAKWKASIRNGDAADFSAYDLRRSLDTWKFAQ